MGRIARIGAPARAAALLLIGALALHELRYLVAFGAEAPSILAQHGHGYLEWLAPLVVAAAAAAIVASLLAPALLRRLPDGGGACTEARAAGYAVGLLAVFFAQELAEGALLSGHPAGLEGVLAGGGWLALPLAIAFGALAACVAGWLDRAELAVARLTVARRTRPPKRIGRPVAQPRPLHACLDLAFGFARRPPPAAPSV
ncbi:MAG: hypothetical protein ACRDK9_08450 [Solirubrobacterales bacterium]